MNVIEIEQIKKEIEQTFTGRRIGKVFQLSRHSFAIDLYPHNGAYLFVDIDPKIRSTYLIKRRLKELERSSMHSSPLAIQIRKQLSGAELVAIERPPDAKVLKLRLEIRDQVDVNGFWYLIIQLGGKQPNVFILDESEKIVASANESLVAGQSIDSIYAAPSDFISEASALPAMNGGSLSEALDGLSREMSSASSFDTLASTARKLLTAEIAKRHKLVKNLENDLAGHGDAEQWKRFGDLILANISNIRRDGNKLIVVDYFDPEIPEIEIEVDENRSPTDAANDFFKRYTKSRNAASAIASRMSVVGNELGRLEDKKIRLELAIENRDEDSLAKFLPAKKVEPPPGKRREPTDNFKGARQFVSSDGFEILVGKKAADNDYLTFRVARSLDLWLHAADYPGSHVVVRNPNRKDIPDRTLIESAQLAAFYSDAREKPKAAVNYTQKKFVNKPKRSAPGLVSLSSFKTILVEPKVAL